MAKFCPHCGKPLQEGVACTCEESKKAAEAFNSFSMEKFTQKVNKESIKKFFENLKNRMGIGDPQRNQGDAYERDRKCIIPDCVKASEGEISVKQYNICMLRNKILGIPYIKALGRLQVTNKRVIFRAPGVCVGGRTTLQHEFAIDEVAGIEARREYSFSFSSMFLATLVTGLGSIIPSWILSLMRDGEAAVIIFGLLFGFAGCVPFFMVKKRWLSKLLCLGASIISFAYPALEINVKFFFFLTMIPVFFAWVAIFVYSIRPNLILQIKTKGTTPAIDIKRKRVGLLSRIFGAKSTEQEDHTGFTEIMPAKDAETCIREIDAIINDIQKLGDFGIEKWKS